MPNNISCCDRFTVVLNALVTVLNEFMKISNAGKSRQIGNKTLKKIAVYVYGLDEWDQMNRIVYLHVANRPTAF